jgi:rare lipoprotein A
MLFINPNPKLEKMKKIIILFLLIAGIYTSMTSNKDVEEKTFQASLDTEEPADYSRVIAIIEQTLVSADDVVKETTPKYTKTNVVASQCGHYKVGQKYEIGGKSYTPREDYNYSETGTASWYGKGFHGRKTSNGEIYDMNELTAAHPTLPIPSMVKVTNLENGISVVLRINDRGPFAKNRIIDVSKKGAELLGFQEQGTTKVKVEILKEESLALKEELLSKKNS